jgi:ABC-2 type transport system ATP-binding protein
MQEDRQEAALLRFAGVTKQFGGRGVRDLTFHVAPGSVTGVIGPNGSGKTTLLRLAAGILRPARGTILGPPPDRIGWVEEDPALYVDRGAADYLRLFARLRGLEGSRAEESLARWGLREQASSTTRTMSRGQRRRLALARGFLGEPELLLLDEPWSGLDGQWRGRCDDALAGAASRGAAVVFTAHAVEDVRIAERLLVLWGGRIVAHDGADRVVSASRGLWVHEFQLEGGTDRRTIPALDASFVASELDGRTGQLRIVTATDASGAPDVLAVVTAAGLNAAVAGPPYPLSTRLAKS